MSNSRGNTANLTLTERAPADANGRCPAAEALEAEPGSFRDRTGRVYVGDGVVLRGLNRSALEAWEILASKPLYDNLVREGKLVRTERIEMEPSWSTDSSGEWAAFLQHERIPFISYPYEWSFGMLQDAALLQLEVLVRALDEGMTLKDASAFNIQWRGAKPVFIDIPSFEPWREGEPWVGYRQFCEMFLYPLLLQAYKGVSFQPWLRGRIDGIPVEDCARLMSLRDLLRGGVFKHVYLQSKLQSGRAGAGRDVKGELRTAGFSKDLIRSNARGLAKLIGRLSWRQVRSTWSHYASDNSYADLDQQRKTSFVRNAINARPRDVVWDLGCNTGTFSRIAAENARMVIAMDSDHLSIERLYQSLKAEGNTTILPLVANIADPSPKLGWRLLERKGLDERGRPDLTLCLALVHHLVIGANIPMREVLDWLAGLGTDLVIEFVTRDDPMVQELLRNKDDNYSDYHLDCFEAWLSERFVIDQREMLSSGTRIMYSARNRAS